MILTATLNAIRYNNRVNTIFDSSGELQGKYIGTINVGSFDTLTHLIEYIKVLKLQNEYTVSCSDLPSTTLEVRFTNGQTKKIYDYGELGTFGLKALYDKLSQLRFTQNWIKKE